MESRQQQRTGTSPDDLKKIYLDTQTDKYGEITPNHRLEMISFHPSSPDATSSPVTQTSTNVLVSSPSNPLVRDNVRLCEQILAKIWSTNDQKNNVTMWEGENNTNVPLSIPRRMPVLFQTFPSPLYDLAVAGDSQTSTSRICPRLFC